MPDGNRKHGHHDPDKAVKVRPDSDAPGGTENKGGVKATGRKLEKPVLHFHCPGIRSRNRISGEMMKAAKLR